MCQAGYFVTSDTLGVATCKKKYSGSASKDLFVFSSEGAKSIEWEGRDGLSFDTAYPFLWMAVYDAYQGVSVDVEQWTEVTYNIWVGKGIHWFFNCLEGDLER